MRTTNATKKTNATKRKRSQPKRRPLRASTPRQEAPVSTMPSETTPATETASVKPDDAAVDPAPPAAVAAEVVTPAPARARLMKRSNSIALAAIVIVLASMALPRRQMPAATAPGGGEPQPQTHEELTGRDSSAHATVVASIASFKAAPAPDLQPTAAPDAHPIAATRGAGESPKKTPARPAKNLAAISSASIATVPPLAEMLVKEDSPVDPGPTATVPAPAPSTESAALAQVTITGCLEVSRNDDRFRLADTDGATAPKSRSWRTGFLKKRSAPVDLVGLDTLALEKQVGKRVAATGVLTSRELKATSVRTVSPSCN